MPLITLSNVAKSYDDEHPLFEGIHLVVGSRDRIGLIGPNGAGKSTLLKMLAGIELPDCGERVARRDLCVGYLEQEPQFPPDLSVEAAVQMGLVGRKEVLDELENLYAEIAEPQLSESRLHTLAQRQEQLQHRLDRLGGHDVEHRIAAAIDGVGLADAQARCGTLSGGEARRVAVAKLLVGVPDILLLDEPTNHLDTFVIAWLEKQLSALKVPLVLVTHDRFLLDRVVNRIVEIDRGNAYAYPGNYHIYVERRAERLARDQRAEKSRIQLLKRETEWMRAGVLARATKAKARIDRFQELSAAKKLVDPAQLEMAIPPGPRLGTRVLDLEKVSFAYGERAILKNLDLHLEAGMRLGIVGPNGVGKTTLLRILLGQLQPDSGVMRVGETVKFASIDQKREDLDPEATVVEEVAGKGDHVEYGQRKVHVAGFLDSFLFPGKRKMVKVGSLSGGERGRVLLAKLLLQDCNVLALDEPTNDLDLMTLRALEEALCAFAGNVLLVSHDRWFLDRVATHILYMDGQGGAFLHTGDVSSLLERWTPARTPKQKQKNLSGKNATPDLPLEGATLRTNAPTKPTKLSYKEQRELEQVVEQIAAQEKRLAELHQCLEDPKTYTKAKDFVANLQQEQSQTEAQLEQNMIRWEELASRCPESR